MRRLPLLALLCVACLPAAIPLPVDSPPEVQLVAAPALAQPQAKQTRKVEPVSAAGLIENERNTIDIFDAAAPATVFVSQHQLVSSWGRTQEVERGSGTGFVWDIEGHVVTNYHVVDGAERLTVTLHDGRTVDARVVGGEPRKDIAVLKIEPSDLTPIRLPDKGVGLRVGQKAIAIGNPFGLDHTLTSGVVSALGREMLGYGGVTITGMVQTDASINPGNSGGPLLNSAGELIGMNTMIYSKTGSSNGIGFAVPVETVRRVVPEIIAHGRVRTVGMGVTLVDDRMARRAGVRGVIVRTVSPGSPAEAVGMSGLRQSPNGVALGDVIVTIGGEGIVNYDDLYNALDGREPGDTVEVGLLRDGAERTVDVELALFE
jgi:S1-C subfamily serine protease